MKSSDSHLYDTCTCVQVQVSTPEAEQSGRGDCHVCERISANFSFKKIDIMDLPVTIAFNFSKGAFDILTTRTSVNEEMLVLFL